MLLKTIQVRAFSASIRRGHKLRHPALHPLLDALEPRTLFDTLPDGFAESSLATTLNSPTAMAVTSDGRVFVTEQTGGVRIIEGGELQPHPLLTVSTDSSMARGLLGIALDPNFDQNHFLYLNYTSTAGSAHQRISRFTTNGDSVVAGSELDLLDLPANLPYGHLGGAIHFGADNKLYISTGDNFSPDNAQSLATLHGKILRINSDGSIPSDNPFYKTLSGNLRSIWAYGLRNPFTFAVQPTTGRIFLNDVGEAAFEEINDGIAGSNYGWAATEGYTTNPAYRSPLLAYAHGNTDSTGDCISGGAFYNPAIPQFPAAYTGKYFFADYVNGWIHVLNPTDNSVASFASGILNPVDLQVGPDGSLYCLARGTQAFGGTTATGLVEKITYTGSQAPTISTQPANQLGSVGHPVTFTVAAVGSAPLSYQWQRNSVDIDQATSASYTLPSASVDDDGAQFAVVVTNAFSTATSTPATLSVTTAQPPTATINVTLPNNQATYTAGDTVQYSAAASDPQDGAA